MSATLTELGPLPMQHLTVLCWLACLGLVHVLGCFAMQPMPICLYPCQLMLCMTRIWPCFLQPRALHPWPSLSPPTTLFSWLFLDFVKSFHDIAPEPCPYKGWPCLCACWQSSLACLVMSCHVMLHYTPSQRAILIHSHICRTHQVCFNHHNLIDWDYWWII